MIAEVVTVSRSPLVQAYVIVIVMAVCVSSFSCLVGNRAEPTFNIGLITLMFMFATASVLCGYELDPGVLVVPVATLFAITQLRSSMPGAPEGFGTNIFSICEGLLYSMSLYFLLSGAIIGKCSIHCQIGYI